MQTESFPEWMLGSFSWGEEPEMPPFLECVQWGPSSVKYASSIDGFGDQKDVPFDEARRGDAPHSTKLFFFLGADGSEEVPKQPPG